MSDIQEEVNKLKENDVPRFVVTISDTHTIMGDRFYSISAGADSLDQFFKLIPKKKRTNEARTELQNMFVHMQKAVDDLEKDFEVEGEIIEEVEGEDSGS